MPREPSSKSEKRYGRMHTRHQGNVSFRLLGRKRTIKPEAIKWHKS